MLVTAFGDTFKILVISLITLFIVSKFFLLKIFFLSWNITIVDKSELLLSMSIKLSVSLVLGISFKMFASNLRFFKKNP